MFRLRGGNMVWMGGGCSAEFLISIFSYYLDFSIEKIKNYLIS